MTQASLTTFPTYSPGFQQRVAFRAETTVGDTFSLSTGWAATNQELKVLSFAFTEDIERTEDMSKQRTLTLLDQFDGIRTGTFTLERYADVPTSMGPLPDEDVLLNAFGLQLVQYMVINTLSGALTVGETLTGGTSGETCVYRSTLGSGEIEVDTLSGTFTKGETFTGGTSTETFVLDYTINRYGFDSDLDYSSIGLNSDTGSVGEMAKGAFITAIQYNWDGGDAVKMTVEGMTQTQARCSTSAVNNGGGYASSSTAIVVDQAERFEVGSLIQFDGDNNSLKGYQVTAIDYTTDTLTILPALVTGVADDAVVGPVFATNVAPTGSHIDSTAGSVFMDVTGAVTVCSPSGFIRIEVGYGDNRDCFGSDTYDAAWAMHRRVTGEVTCKLKAADMAFVNESRRESQSKLFKVILGPADEVNLNGQISITGSDVQVDPVSTIEIPEEDAVQVTFALKFMGSGNDEVEINYEHDV